MQRFWHYNKQLTIARYLAPDGGDLILDVGCGSGVVSNFLAQSGAEVIGIDGNEGAVSFARQTFHAPNVSFQLGPIDHHFSTDRPVDKIYCLELIEHIYPDQATKMLHVFHSHLKAGGRVFLTTPNYRSPWPAIEWLMDRFRLAPKMSGHQHVAKYHRRTLAGLCRSAGFTIERIATTCFLSPWLAAISWRLALRGNKLETGSPFGCIIACVLKKERS